MRAVVQRVTRAEVRVEGQVAGRIGRGLCVLLGAGKGDGDEDVTYMVDKLANLRIFEDDADEVGGAPPGSAWRGDGEGSEPPKRKMNRSVLEIGGGALVISQFTLFGDARKGRRPSFTDALEPEEAKRRYEQVVAGLRAAGVSPVETGRFAAMMEVDLVNWGPVTILLDSKRLF